MKRWLLVLAGALLLLAPLKFTAPVNLQTLAVLPSSLIEWVYWSWPNQLGVMAAFLFCLLVLERAPSMRLDLLGLLPAVFLVTQVVAMSGTICRQTSVDTVLHFGACVAVFYVAARCAREERWEGWILGALAAATLLVCVVALEQQFGGLAATRRYAAAYVDPSRLPEDMRAKLTSNRVFGTLVYPNALAGYLVMVFAPVLVWLWSKAEGRVTKIVVAVAAGGVMLACLAFSGSRGGFVALAVSVVAWLACGKGGGRRWLWGAVALAVLAIVVAAALRGGLVHLGRSSLEARLDYWGGAVRIIRDHPWVGTGPGTFGSIYPKYKTAMTEEAQLVHNNFLQMWSDSGVAGFVAFAALWGVGLWETVRLARRRGDMLSVALVAAIAGWAAHGLVDFDLYVPAIALPAFALLGIVQGLKTTGGQACAQCGGTVRWGIRLGIVVVMAAAVLWFEGRMIMAATAYGESQATRDTNNEQQLQAAATACRYAPSNPQYWSAFGDAAFRLNDLQMAIECYRRAAELDPMRAARHGRLARACRMAGQYKPAMAAFRRAMSLNPTDPGYPREVKRLAEESVRQGRGGLIQSPPVSGEKN